MTTEGVSFSRTSRLARVNSDQGTHVGGEELERLGVAAEDEVILTPTNRRYCIRGHFICAECRRLSLDVFGVVDVDEAVEVRHERNSHFESEVGAPDLTNLSRKGTRESSGETATNVKTLGGWGLTQLDVSEGRALAAAMMRKTTQSFIL